MTRTPRIRSVLGLVTAAALLSVSACGGGSGAGSADKDSSSSESPGADSSAGGDPDLAGVPEVVAEVNGEEVTREEFAPIYQAQLQQATAQAQTTGEAPDEDALKKQTVEDLVDTELLAQEAEARGIEVSDRQVDDELAALAEQNQLGSAEELLAAVEAQGVTPDQARSQVGIQLMVEQLVVDEDGPFEPTDKELRALYAQAKQAAQSSESGQEIPAFADVRAQLVEQARSQQVGTVAGALVEDLRKDATITINL